MSGLSDQSEQDFLNHCFRPGAGAYSPPSNNYISLHDADPGDTGSNEVTGGSYARFSMTPSTSWEDAGASVARTIRNNVVVQFTDMPAVTVTHVGIWSASTSGTFMAGDALTASKSVSAGGTVEFAAGVLRILFSAGKITDYLAEAWLDFQFHGQSMTRPSGHDLMIYNGDPTGSGNPVSGASLQSIAFGAPSVNGTRYEVAQSGAISFTSLNADTCDWWLVQDDEGTPNPLAYFNQASLSLQNGDDVDFADGTVIVGID